MGQLAALREENSSLRQQLDEWISRVRENETISKRLQQSELKVLAAQTLEQIAAVVVDEIGNDNGVITTLVVDDPELELARILESEPDPVVSGCIIPIHEFAHFKSLFTGPPAPCFDVLDASLLQSLFPENCLAIKSTLLIPLTQGGELIGSLNFGSIRAHHFEPGMATDIIERLAAIIAVALLNTLNQYRLRQAGLTDPLTALNNRRFFEQRLVEEFDRARRTRRPLCCLMIDIDFFKQVNDSYGHQVGDKVLQRVSQTMVEQMRRTDVLARYGGEEFIVLLPETLATTAMDVAERLRARVASELIVLDDGGELSITVSIGLSVLDSSTSEQDTPKTLVAYADQALYKAKHGGRNRVEQEVAS
jgi:diguanylate cyclase (GGDEF)-like protein